MGKTEDKNSWEYSEELKSRGSRFTYCGKRKRKFNGLTKRD